jgi:heterodisulfide reductase subunit A
MYSIKQAQLMAGSLPLADITIYYMDIRAFGKGYEQFYQNAKVMGINFVKAKVGKITEDKDHNPILRIERQETDSCPEEVKHDMVVLSQGILPSYTNVEQEIKGTRLGDHNFINAPNLPFSSNSTDVKGVFVAGAAVSPKDIVDTVQEASSAAAEVLDYINSEG